MKKITLLFTMLLALAFPLMAQTVQWAHNFGGSGEEIGKSIEQTTDGGYIMIGESRSSDGDFTQNHGTQSSDYGVIKIDASGNKQWAKNYGGSSFDKGIAIQQTADGGYIMIGESFSFDGDFSQIHSNNDYGVIKIDVLGNVQWAKNYGGEGYEEAHFIQQTTDGGYIMIGISNSFDGDFSQNHGGSECGVIKIDAFGNIQWAKNFGGSGEDAGYNIQQTTDSGYIIIGASNSSDGNFSQNHGGRDYGVIKIDAFGNIQWAKNFGGSGEDWGYDIQQTTDSGYIMIGISYSSDGDFTQNHGSVDHGVIKIDASGNKEWVKNFGGASGDVGISIKQTIDGGYIFAGETQSTDGDYQGVLGYGNLDAGIIKIDVFGNKEWVKKVGGTSYDYFHSIKQTTDGGYIVVGTSYSSDGVFTQNHGTGDYAVVKLSPYTPSCTSDATVAYTLSQATATLTVTPLPNTNYTYTWYYAGNPIGTGLSTSVTFQNYGLNTVELVVTLGNGCPDETIVTTVDVPCTLSNPSAGTAVNACVGSPSVVLSATAQGGITPYTYEWSNNGGVSQTTSILTSTAATTTYTVTITDAIGCTASASNTVQINALPIANAGQDVTANCTTPSVTLTATGGTTYAWSGGISQAVAFTPTVTTTYTVTVTNQNACSATDAVVVTVNKTPPVANAGANSTINCTTPTTTLNATGGVSYAWSSGTQGGIVSPATTTTYTVTVTGANGCTATATRIITVNKTVPVANAGIDVTACNGVAVTLTATAVANATYAWSNGGGGQSISVSPTSPTTYTVTVTNTINGCSASDAVVVTPSSSVANNTLTIVGNNGYSANCSGNINITLQTSATGSGLTYKWFKNNILIATATTSSFVVNSTGVFNDKYYCQVRNACNATNSQTVVVSNVPITGIDGNACIGKPKTVVSNAQITSYNWQKPDIASCMPNSWISVGVGGTSATYTPPTLGKYRVIITFATGCTATKFICANVAGCPVAPTTTSDYVAFMNYYESIDWATYSPDDKFSDDDEATILDQGAILEEEGISLAVAPNPTQGTTNIQYTIAETGRVKISLITPQGTKRLLNDTQKDSGEYSESLDLEQLAPGLYYVELATEKAILVKKVVKM